MNRPTLMLGGLGATLAATAYLALQPETPEPPAAAMAVARRPLAVAAAPAVRTTPLIARRQGWTELPPAALAAWAPPAPPAPPPVSAVAAVAPVRPQPPTFPYRWIGLLVQDDRPTALLDSSQRSLGVQVGQVLDPAWRVERISAERIELIWLPTGDAVTLDKR